MNPFIGKTTGGKALSLDAHGWDVPSLAEVFVP